MHLPQVRAEDEVPSAHGYVVPVYIDGVAGQRHAAQVAVYGKAQTGRGDYALLVPLVSGGVSSLSHWDIHHHAAHWEACQKLKRILHLHQAVIWRA